MLGITTETPEELNDTINLIKTYKPDLIEASMFTPMPGTLIFDYCIEKGFFKKPQTLEEWAIWTGDMIHPIHNTSNISSEVLTKTIRKLWMIGFYKNKLKRFLYWMKAGEYRYVIKSIRRVFEIRRGVFQIPGLGIIYDSSEKKSAPVLNPIQEL